MSWLLEVYTSPVFADNAVLGFLCPVTVLKLGTDILMFCLKSINMVDGGLSEKRSDFHAYLYE